MTWDQSTSVWWAHLTGMWPRTDTFHHHTPGYFIFARANCESTADLGHNNAYLRLSPALCNCLFKWGPFPVGGWSGEGGGGGGEQSTLIHQSVVQPPQEVVNIVDLWNGHSCLGCAGVEVSETRRTLAIASSPRVTSVSQSTRSSVNLSFHVFSFCAGRFFSEVPSNREWKKTAISHQREPRKKPENRNLRATKLKVG